MRAGRRRSRYLAKRLDAGGLFALRAPAALNIVCFSARSDDADALNRWIVEDLQTGGAAAPSLSSIDGQPVIRAAIVNHRTTRADIDAFVLALSQRTART